MKKGKFRNRWNGRKRIMNRKKKKLKKKRIIDRKINKRRTQIKSLLIEREIQTKWKRKNSG